MKSNKFLAIAAAAAALLATPLASQAVPVFAAKISDGVNTVEIVDGQGSDLVADGEISYSGTLGAWNVTFAFGSSSFDPLYMHLSAGFQEKFPETNPNKVLTISLSQTGLSSGAGAVSVGVGAFGGGSGVGAASWSAYLDDADTLYGTGALVNSSSGYTTSSGSASLLMNDTYSATLITTFDVTGVVSGAATRAGSLDLTMQVPEPGTIALAGLGLLALGAMRRRKA